MKRLLSKASLRVGQSGGVHTLPLFLIIAAVGIISYLLISSTAPFKAGLFGNLNPKPASNAMMGGDLLNNDCNLPGQAFCDTFDAPFKEISRTGQLDPTRWEVSHITTTGANTDQGYYDRWTMADAMFCKIPISGVYPPNDYFECDGGGTESNHFMEVTNDDADYMYNDEMITQPFDFTNRTGTVTFNVDAKTSGGHGWWIEMWITPDPVPGPHLDPGHIQNVNNAVGIFFQGDCLDQGGVIVGSDAGSSLTSVNIVHVARNGVFDSPAINLQGLPGVNGCFKTQPDMRNLIQVKINQQHLEVWASDYDGSNFREVAFADNMGLTFTKGFIHFQDSHYDSFKAFNCNGCINSNVTYHWDNIGFDGPVLPLLHKASVKDSLVPWGDGLHINLGWRFNQGLDSGPISTESLDLTGATQAWLTLSVNSPASFSYQLNGGTWHSYNQFGKGIWSSDAIPLSLSELRSGVNTINFKSDTGNWSLVANVDIYAASNSPVVAPTPCPACPTFAPHQTASPTPVPTPTPTAGPTPTPGTNSFTSEYWNSGNGGSPTIPVYPANLVRNDPTINFDWGSGSPDPSINADHFIARWNGNFTLNAGTYTFSTNTDDGVRLYVDNQLIIDHWVDQGPTTYTASKNLTAGTHNVRMEYYENTQGAVAQLSWSASGTPNPTPSPTPIGTPGTCPKKTLGDVDCDGAIGIFDFNALISNFGKTGTGLQGDLDGNGKVDIFDFNTLVTNFGK